MTKEAMILKFNAQADWYAKILENTKLTSEARARYTGKRVAWMDAALLLLEWDRLET